METPNGVVLYETPLILIILTTSYLVTSNSDTAMQSPAISTPESSRNQSLVSHFDFYSLIEKLSKEIETGNSDFLVSELNSQFENCQQILNSISASLDSKAMTVDGQKRKLEESEKLLEQRRLLYNVEIVSHAKSNKPDEEERN